MMMRLTGIKAGAIWQQTIVVIGALICLCASDSAGLRLLPLPALSALVVSSSSRDDNPGASQSPSRKNDGNTHIEMLASQYRSREGDNHEQPATHDFQASLHLQPTNLAGAAIVYAPLNANTPSLATPAVRGPPRFTN
jgi:hypothetical protein